MTIQPTHLDFSSPPRDRVATKLIVCHHTAGPSDQSVESIHNYHKNERGWLGIGYNLVQTADGKWHEGRGIGKQGAHARGYNQRTIGISLTGNFAVNPVPDDRWQSLVEMCSYLCNMYELSPRDVVGHNELGQTECPGYDMDELRRAVEGTPVYRVTVDKIQVGAYRHPERAVRLALEQHPDEIFIKRV